MPKKKNWIATELVFILLAPLLVLLAVLLAGVLFDQWYKDPMLILKATGISYAILLFLRVFMWIYKMFN